MQPNRRGSTGPPIRSDLVPKPGGGHRRLIHLDPADGARYLALVRALAMPVEEHLDAGVLGNRVTTQAGPRLLAPWRPARRRWRAAVAAITARGPTVVTADVADFYGSITPAVVDRALRRCGVTDSSAEEVIAFLRSLEERGVRGLPVGPKPSAPLANAVLATGDRALRELGLHPIRWVDDVVVACPDAATADRAIEVLARTLRADGLELHATKTARWLDPEAFRRRSAPPSGGAWGPRGMMRGP